MVIDGDRYGSDRLDEHIGEKVVVWFEHGAFRARTRSGEPLGILHSETDVLLGLAHREQKAPAREKPGEMEILKRLLSELWEASQ